MTDPNRQVQNVVDEFVNKLTQIARETAAQVVMGGFGSTKSAPKRAAAKGRGAKRSSQNLEAMQTKVLGFIKSHPGSRTEEINRKLGTTTKDVALPIRKLIASKAIKAEGQRRATKYFAGAAAAKGEKKSGKRSKK
jgi:predicted HTH transcriptional regulator